MILFSEADRIVMERAEIITETERVPLAESVGRVISSELRCDRNIPPFNRVAMDGYACRREDLGNSLKIVETVAAGYRPEKEIGKIEDRTCGDFYT